MGAEVHRNKNEGTVFLVTSRVPNPAAGKEWKIALGGDRRLSGEGMNRESHSGLPGLVVDLQPTSVQTRGARARVNLGFDPGNAKFRNRKPFSPSEKFEAGLVYIHNGKIPDAEMRPTG